MENNGDDSAVNAPENTDDGNVTVVSAPSVTAMIGDVVGSSTPDEQASTAHLDELRITVVDDDDEEEEPEQQPRKRRGRPPGSGSGGTPKPPKLSKKEALSELERVQRELADERARNDANKIGQLATSIEMAAHLAFGYASTVRGPHWALEQAEAKSIGEATAVCLAPYAEQVATQLPWVVAVGTIANVIWKRVQVDKELVARLPAGGA